MAGRDAESTRRQQCWGNRRCRAAPTIRRLAPTRRGDAYLAEPAEAFLVGGRAADGAAGQVGGGGLGRGLWWATLDSNQ